VIRFNGATKRFAGRVVVDALTIEIRAGEVTALLGPNGSGKTTTLKMAAGLIKPDGGSVTIESRPSWEAAARSDLAYLPQRVAFSEALTGREVVEFYRVLRGAPVDSAQRALRFAALNGAGGRPVGTYSGGMTQRLGLAVATLPGARILLLDEPGAALDPEGLAGFHRLLREERGTRTVLFTSHQIAEVERVADRVLVLNCGRLVADVMRAELPIGRGPTEPAPLEQWYDSLVGASGIGRLGPGS
jgi:Cu-processing system ATP-binding protein